MPPVRRLSALFVAALIAVVVSSSGVAFAAFSSSSSSPGSVGTATLAAPTSLAATSGAQLSWIATTSAFASGTRVYRSTLLKFTLPATPANCTVTAATLQLTVSSGTSGRTLQAFQAAATWTETGVTWNTQPATTGSAATTASATSGTLSFSVLSQVTA